MWKRIALLVVSVATLAGATLIGATSASADSRLWYGDAGYGQFQSYGEIFTACDTKADGYGIRVDWYVEENPVNAGYVGDWDGANNGCGSQNASVVEGHHVLYRTCITNGGTTVACTGYLRDTA